MPNLEHYFVRWPEGVGVDCRFWLSRISAAPAPAADFLYCLERRICTANCPRLECFSKRSGVCDQVRTEFLAVFQEQQVGGAVHRELWIPAEDLPAMNRNIVGLIEVIAELTGEQSV
jgi:hypothetical protein